MHRIVSRGRELHAHVHVCTRGMRIERCDADCEKIKRSLHESSMNHASRTAAHVRAQASSKASSTSLENARHQCKAAFAWSANAALDV
ncbi:hypothetical protein WS71_05180 [Burkholderia mayonis]|uniref:Uncharacterized protein n=1 Tax=Burkholderia mayonis TaxID=1385591 RepID=A0A1B4FSX4_9BURK|nr:hypothetical protein WS71_05180 [Burkholderia mayonis]KVE57698.1 hypothetical protein WS71_26640 [Burkholderia mayonis]